MNDKSETNITWAGRHLSIAVRDGWEFAIRNTRRPVVGIVAITGDRRVVLVEQFRTPAGQTVIELPAGLAGDVAGEEHEPLLAAAQRELWEETGYRAAKWTQLIEGYSSPGLTNESMVLFLAEHLTKAGAGGGDASEAITIHEVPLDDVLSWLTNHDYAVSLKLLAGLYAAQNHLKQLKT